MGVDRTSQSGRLEPAKAAVANPVPNAKMAERLPKWQKAPANCQNGSLLQILCQTVCQYDIGEKITNEIFPVFFSCNRRYVMYNQGMIGFDRFSGVSKMENYIGYGFRGVRKDGRVFVGVVQDMRTVKDRTLLVIRQADNAHKSVYLEDMTGGHSFSLCNGQPVLVN